MTKEQRIKKMQRMQGSTGLNVANFAKKMGVSARTVYAWYNGQNSITNMALVLAAYVVKEVKGV